MDFHKIAIIGAGLIGSSFGLSVKKQGFNGKITGIGRSTDNLIKAKELGAIDSYTSDHAEGIKGADLILLASPVGQFKEIMESISEHIESGAIVTDVGSVKAGIIKKVESMIPDTAFFVGTHPIAGKECSGAEAAADDLFYKAKCIITPTPGTDKGAFEKVVDLWKSVGARTMIMSPEEHDLIYSAVSHLPHVIAYALVNAVSEVKEDIMEYSGGGLKDMTRIALSPPELWRDICSYNKDNILSSLDKFSLTVANLKQHITDSDWASLEKEFQKAKEARHFIESD
jgi:prephenate dehydrogenase